MSSEPAINIRQLTKAFQIYDKPIDRLKQMLWRGRRRYYSEFLAVKGVDLDVARGETVGIVGRNGSGKSTLLRLICGTLPKTSGVAQIRGRIAPLLSLGAGFNPEFSGRENAFLNAAVFGMSSARIRELYPQIAEFADIGDFINRPVKIYSSGMRARLAFAVAFHLDPDILVIDEVLSVGDEAFRRKCSARMERIKERGATILFVSHSAQSVIELCDRALLLEAGQRLLLADPKTVITQYHRLLYGSTADYESVVASIKALDHPAEATTIPAGAAESVSATTIEGAVRAPASVQPTEPRTAAERAAQFERFDPALKPESTLEYASKGARILDVHLQSRSGQTINVVGTRSLVTYTYRVIFDRDCFVDHFGMALKATSGLPLVGMVLRSDSGEPMAYQAGTTVRVRFDLDIRLGSGVYFFNAGVYGFTDGEDPTYLHRIVDVALMRVERLRHRPIISYVDLSRDIEDIGSIEIEPRGEAPTRPKANASFPGLVPSPGSPAAGPAGDRSILPASIPVVIEIAD